MHGRGNLAQCCERVAFCARLDAQGGIGQHHDVKSPLGPQCFLSRKHRDRLILALHRNHGRAVRQLDLRGPVNGDDHITTDLTTRDRLERRRCSGELPWT